MAVGGASLKLKRLRQRFGINAAKLARAAQPFKETLELRLVPWQEGKNVIITLPVTLEQGAADSQEQHTAESHKLPDRPWLRSRWNSSPMCVSEVTLNTIKAKFSWEPSSKAVRCIRQPPIRRNRRNRRNSNWLQVAGFTVSRLRYPLQENHP